MQISYIINKIIFSVTIAMGVIACGGGGSDSKSGSGGNSSTGGGDSSSDNSGSGGCVTIARQKVGQVVRIETKAGDGKIVIDMESEITAFSDTSMTVESTSLINGKKVNNTLVKDYSIANNYIDVTKETTTTYIDVSGMAFSFDNVISYDPYRRRPIDKVCEGETLTSTYTQQGSSSGNSSSTEEQSRIMTIEAVNVSKTTDLGTFKTVRMTTESADTVTTAWIDINSGHPVLIELGDSTGKITRTIELVEKNF